MKCQVVLGCPLLTAQILTCNDISCEKARAPSFQSFIVADEHSYATSQITLNVDVVCFPLHNALMVGQTKLSDKARCYIRYKFYDKGKYCMFEGILVGLQTIPLLIYSNVSLSHL